MDGNSLEPCHRYLLRMDGKQVPVVYDGRALWHQHGGEEGIRTHAFTRIDNGEWVFKQRASAVSRHYDDCCFGGSGNCNCQQRLEALRKP